MRRCPGSFSLPLRKRAGQHKNDWGLLLLTLIVEHKKNAAKEGGGLIRVSALSVKCGTLIITTSTVSPHWLIAPASPEGRGAEKDVESGTLPGIVVQRAAAGTTSKTQRTVEV